MNFPWRLGHCDVVTCTPSLGVEVLPQDDTSSILRKPPDWLQIKAECHQMKAIRPLIEAQPRNNYKLEFGVLLGSMQRSSKSFCNVTES